MEATRRLVQHGKPFLQNNAHAYAKTVEIITIARPPPSLQALHCVPPEINGCPITDIALKGAKKEKAGRTRL